MFAQAHAYRFIRRLVASSAMVMALALVVTLVPIAGADVDDPPLPSVAFVARADNPVDALAAAGVAGQLGAPVYLSFPDSLHPDAASGLTATDPDVVVLAGGPVALSEQVERDVAELLPSAEVIRKAGETRTSTAVALSELAAELGFERPIVAGATVPGDAGITGEMTVAGVDVAASITALQAFHQPSDAVPVWCFVGLGVGVESTPNCQRADTNDVVVPVPAGQVLVITDIIAHRTGSVATGDFIGVVGVDDADNFPTFPRFEVHGTALQPFQHTFATPIVVLTEGERLALRNDTASDIGVEFYVSGVLTTDLASTLD